MLGVGRRLEGGQGRIVANRIVVRAGGVCAPRLCPIWGHIGRGSRWSGPILDRQLTRSLAGQRRTKGIFTSMRISRPKVLPIEALE